MLARGPSTVLEYELLGDGLETVVLLPALGADRTMWELLLPHLTDDYSVVLCESGGHHRWPQIDGDLRTRADAVQAVMDAVALERAHIVGVSMGGMLAQILATSCPERVHSLCLVSTTSTYEPERSNQMRERVRIVETKGMGAIADATTERWLSDDFRVSHPEWVDRVRSMLLSADPTAYQSAALAVADVSLGDELAQIRAPTLVVQGSSDASLPENAAQTLCEGIAGAQVHFIEGGAHLLTVDSAEKLGSRLRRFLREQQSDDPELDRLAPSRVW